MILEQVAIPCRTISIGVPNHTNSQFVVMVNEAAGRQQGAKPITESAERNQGEISHTLCVYFPVQILHCLLATYTHSISQNLSVTEIV